MTEHQDHTLPQIGEKWSFSEDVTKVFDEMLARSIPSYTEMRLAVHRIGGLLLKNDWSQVLDLGASRGEAVDWFIQNRPAHHYHLVEVSEPMADVLDTRYRDIDTVNVHRINLTQAADFFAHRRNRVSVALSVLTLMFVPIEYRQAVLKQVYDSLEPGGALILVEKMLGATPELNDLLNRAYYEMKAANGYTPEEIDRKRLSLEGVLVPLTEAWNMDMLQRVGFDQIDCFFRSLQFAGFVCIK